MRNGAPINRPLGWNRQVPADTLDRFRLKARQVISRVIAARSGRPDIEVWLALGTECIAVSRQEMSIWLDECDKQGVK